METCENKNNVFVVNSESSKNKYFDWPVKRNNTACYHVFMNNNCRKHDIKSLEFDQIVCLMLLYRTYTTPLYSQWLLLIINRSLRQSCYAKRGWKLWRRHEAIRYSAILFLVCLKNKQIRIVGILSNVEPGHWLDG